MVKFENVELFCPLGAMKMGVQQRELLHLIQPSQDPTYIFVEIGGGGLGLELNFLRFQIEENIWKAKF